MILLVSCSLGPKRGNPVDAVPEVDEALVLLLEPDLRGVSAADRDDALRTLEGVISREGLRAVREGEVEALRDSESRAALRGDGSPEALGSLATALGVGRVLDGWLGQNEARFIWVFSAVDHRGLRQGVVAGAKALGAEGRWPLMARSAREVLFPRPVPLEPGAGWVSGRLEERKDAWLCLGEHLLSAVAPSGRATLEIRIEPDGRASEVSVEESTLGDRSLEFCLEETARGIHLRDGAPVNPERVRIPVVVPK